MFEVEQKFRAADLPAIRNLILDKFDIVDSTIMNQVDQYLAHPSRDFADTDEALRIRRIEDRVFLTYKGPKTRSRDGFKTRPEIDLELEFVQGEIDQLLEMMLLLGFRPLRRVSKLREKIQIRFQNYDVVFALDNVDDLGSFVEIEVIADVSQIEDTQNAIVQLAAQLGLCNPITSGYLQLLRQAESE